MSNAAHGKNTVLKIGTLAAPTVLTDISGYLSEAARAGDTPMADGTTFGDGVQVHVPGVPDFTVNLTGVVHPTIHTILSDLQTANPQVAVDFEFGPLGDDAGDPEITGTAYIGNYSHTSPIQGVVGFTATLVAAGPITDDLYGAS
jgi:hypothetical protein